MKTEIDGDCLWSADLVEFRYDGGSNPGSKRTVLVLSDKPQTISCWDFGKEDLRTFSRSKISDVRFLDEDEFKEITVSDLPESMQDLGTICQGYLDAGYKVYQNGDSVTAVLIQPKKKLRTGSKDKLIGYHFVKVIGFYLGDKYVRLTMNPGKPGGTSVTLDIDGNVISDEVTVADLIEVLCPQE